MVDTVDRIPYAVELIAARVNQITPDALLDELNRSRSAQHIEMLKGIVGWSWRASWSCGNAGYWHSCLFFEADSLLKMRKNWFGCRLGLMRLGWCTCWAVC